MKNVILLLTVLFLSVFNPTTFAAVETSSTHSLKGEDLFTQKPLEVKAKAKGLVIAFLSARCPCSHSHVPVIEKLSQEFPDFQFVAIHSNADEPTEQAKTYFQNAKLGFPILQDEKNKMADQFKAAKTPHVYVLGTNGETLYKGGMTNSSDGPSADRQYLREALIALQAGKKVETPETRSLGCAISRGENYVW